VHNTLWVTGHFHLTIATTVALTFFGAVYWLIPHLTGRTLTPKMNRLGIIQTIVWCIGMFIMSGAMHTVGLMGSPRRTAFTTYDNHPDAVSWMPYHVAMAISGVILFIGVIIMVWNVFALMRTPKGETEFPVAEVSADAGHTPRFLERWGLWIGIAAALIVFAYTIPLIDMINNGVNAPGIRTW